MTGASLGGSSRPMSEPLPDESETEIEAEPEDRDASSLFGEIGSLIEDGRTYAQAEVAYQKTRFSFVLGHAKWALVFGGIAAVLAVMSLFAMVFGLILSLAPILTPIGATVAVTFGMLILAAMLAAVAKMQIGKAKSAFDSKDKSE